MKYSIVMPVYLKDINHLEVVEQAVESIREHSEDYELILVDDGSPFINTMEYALSSIPDLYIRHQLNQGIAPSWNDGIKLARGKYIAVVNDDITASPGWLQAMQKCFSQWTGVGVAAPAVEHLPRYSGMDEDYHWFPGSCFMLSRETIEKVGYFDEQFAPFNFEDTDYWTRVLQSGLTLVRNYDVEVGHREGHVLHTLNYTTVSNINKQKFIEKHGFDPIPVFCGEERFPWEK